MVSQDVILFDDTIKNNIAYTKENALQEEIEKACKLRLQCVIKKLPNGYDTLIGENGIRLSGGKNNVFLLQELF